MRILIFIIIFLGCACSNSGQDGINLQEKLNSKKYTLKFSIESKLLDTVEITAPQKINGSITRNGDYIYVESPLGIGVFQDSLCLYIDKIDSMVSLDRPFSLSTLLVIPFYDPIEIYNYAIKYNNSYKKIPEKNRITHDFMFSSDTVAAKHIVIKEDKNSNSFIIDFTYQSLEDKRRDIISYKMLKHSIDKEKKNIEDFIEEKNGKYSLKSELKGYTFFNNTALESILKRKNP